MAQPYDPLDYDKLAASVVGELLRTPLSPLPLAEHFKGPGVYAVYYGGDFKPYAPLTCDASDVPIYVGCAMPSGARKGGTSKGDASSGSALYSRLNQHANSIEQAKNLRLAHFRCRYLVVLRVWIRLAERFLIDQYRPIWNVCIDGFGNHDPGKGRRLGARPAWDIMHPGRPWAKELDKRESASEVLARLRRFLAETRMPNEQQG